MKKIIITLLSAVAIFAADNQPEFGTEDVQTQTKELAPAGPLAEGSIIDPVFVSPAPVETLDLKPPLDIGGGDDVFIDKSNYARIKWAKPPAWEELEPISIYLGEPVTNITWKIDASTNQMELQLIDQVKTNWLTIERFTNAVANPGKPFLRQIGQVSTNKILSLIYKGRTNNLQIMVVGKEEYPEHRQIIPEPPQQPARRR